MTEGTDTKKVGMFRKQWRGALNTGLIVGKVSGGGRTTENVKMQASPEVKGNTTKYSTRLTGIPNRVLQVLQGFAAGLWQE